MLEGQRQNASAMRLLNQPQGLSPGLVNGARKRRRGLSRDQPHCRLRKARLTNPSRAYVPMTSHAAPVRAGLAVLVGACANSTRSTRFSTNREDHPENLRTTPVTTEPSSQRIEKQLVLLAGRPNERPTLVKIWTLIQKGLCRLMAKHK